MAPAKGRQRAPWPSAPGLHCWCRCSVATCLFSSTVTFQGLEAALAAAAGTHMQFYCAAPVVAMQAGGPGQAEPVAEQHTSCLLVPVSLPVAGGHFLTPGHTI